MKPQNRPILIIFLPSLIFLFFACGNEKSRSDKKNTESDMLNSSITNIDNQNSSNAPSFSSSSLTIKTFEIVDSITNKSLGWGYDIYNDNIKTIHQPIIPALPGNMAFPSEKDAKKTGLYAIDKIKKTGSLPSLSIKELDSLGVIKNK
jgi:hypothetical protein